MAFLIYSVLAFFAIVGISEGKPTDTQDATLTVTARFLKVDPSSRRHHALTKHDIDHLSRGEKHHIRIRFDNGLPPLDMYLTQGSVWNSANAAAVRPSDSRRPASHNLDANCFLRGKLVRGDGAVSINRCGKLTGSIHTSDYQYQIEELVHPEGEEHSGPTTFKLVRTIHKPEEMDQDEEYDRSIMNKVDREVKEKMAENQNHNNETIDRQKRQAAHGIFDITIEMVAYLDAKYADYLYYERDLWTSEIWEYIITKWNLVQAALDDPELVGARVTIALKDVIIWWTNPDDYPADEVGVSERLEWFRDNTPDSNHYDAKVLYTKGTGGHQMGLAYLNGICGTGNVFLVKSPRPEVSLEIHELGHSLGFDHDPDIDGCDSDGHHGGGFMGWESNLRYLPCYRPVLKRYLRSRGHRCLFEENVGSDGLVNNFATPATDAPTYPPTTEEGYYYYY